MAPQALAHNSFNAIISFNVLRRFGGVIDIFMLSDHKAALSLISALFQAH